MPPRFWEKVNTDGPVPAARPELGPCWLWTASLNKGYGQFKWGSGMRMAYKVAYELLLGPVPAGLDLDHLCRVKECVNPVHLEPVTHRENILRGESTVAERARQTRCKRGHLFDKANTSINRNGTRRCLTCARMHNRNDRLRRQELAA